MVWGLYNNRQVVDGCALGKSDLGTFIDIPGGGFVLGAHARSSDEGPPTKVFVSPFRLLSHEVTNSQFHDFVQATGYITEAERNGSSSLFHPSDTPENPLSWWRLKTGASWRTPDGPGSTIENRLLHPVVHVTLNDARAYAAWAGGRIPTEVEWEYAASLGLHDPKDPLSGVRRTDGLPRANVWTGLFPVVNSGRDGYINTAPVGCFEPSKTGAYDMIGNVWEWTETKSAQGRQNFTIKGGSYLCSEDYCQNYRASARTNLEDDQSTSHVGFRIVKD